MSLHTSDVEYVKEDRGYKINGKVSKCWVWQGFITRDGYGVCGCNKQHFFTQRATRYMWQKIKGTPIPKHLEPDHLCPCKACVNPAHIEIVTKQENGKRKYERNPDLKRTNSIAMLRGRSKDANWQYKTNAKRRLLTDNQVCKIRKLYATGKYGQTELGIRFGVGQATIRQIIIGKNYAFVKD